MGGHRRVKRTFHKGQILTLQIQDMAFGGKASPLETEKGRLWSSFKTRSGQTVEAQVVNASPSTPNVAC